MTGRKKILAVEDDGVVLDYIIDTLCADYEILPAKTLKAGWSLFKERRPDLAILDLSLPDGSGIDLCRKIREYSEQGDIPVIMLTARGGLADKAEGFSAGADQYLVKPLESAELRMWTQALLKRIATDKGERGRIHAGRLVLDPDAMLATWESSLIHGLTPKEFELLLHLVRRRPAVVSRKEILSRLWHTVAADNLVDAHLCNLRRKLPPALAGRIQAVPGKGFRYLESI
ncbi:MAG TPA: DNA-binding response regulator [Elusimicrobia bacterium]|nr:DNA-binding response regulator [Elusimicrobiota bacterium]